MSRESEIPSAEVSQVAPLRIRVNGAGDDIAALHLAGQALLVGDRGVVLFTASRRPIFLKTA